MLEGASDFDLSRGMKRLIIIFLEFSHPKSYKALRNESIDFVEV